MSCCGSSSAILSPRRSINMTIPDSSHPAVNPAGTIQRRGRALLNQQCWLWGQDIKHREKFSLSTLSSPADVVLKARPLLDWR
jgi:hypothetical protein